MPNWSQLVKEIGQLGSPFDILRRKYIADLARYTKRNVICYYSGWLQKPELGPVAAVNDTDKNGLMTTINGLDTAKGLDLILHTPGGDTAATESIVDYLWSKFEGNIRCFVPQMAMSAGTMIACSCREIWMGKQSSLGPIDPQFGATPAHGVIEEFERAYTEIVNDPRTVPIWQAIIAKYPPAFIGECKKAVKWSNSLVETWLKRNMLASIKNRDKVVAKILRELGDHSVSLAHNRHLSSAKCKEIGLRIFDLESDQKLQDKVLSVHHIYFHTLSSTPSFKGVRQIYEGDFHAAARCSQKSSQRLLRILQRRAIILFAPLTVQCIPDCFRRCPTTVRHPASKTPEPIKRPLFLKSAYRIRSLFFSK